MKHALLIAASLLPLTACGLWNDYIRPETPAPQAWSTPAPGTEAAWPDAPWWRQFNSPALTAQIDEALKENYDLKAAVARVKEADAQARISGAGLLPDIEATMDASRNRTSGSSRASSALGVISRPHIANAYGAELSASYELDFWGKNWAIAESAAALAEASRFDEQTVRLTTLASVANNWFDILATKERLRIARDNLANAERELTASRNRFDAGVSTALDVAQQESIVATQRAAVPPLELELKQAMNAHAVLLGKLPEALNIPESALDDLSLPTVSAGLPSELLMRRPDVLQAEAQLRSANADIIAARGAFFPSIQLTAAGGYESVAMADLFRPDSMLFSLAGSLVQPIFKGGLLTGQLDFAKARQEELLQNYRKAVLSAFADTENALAAVKHTAEEETAQAAAAQTARKAYNLSQQQLQGGVIDITTALNTQRTLFSAEDAHAQARLAHLQAIVGLYRALGGGWKSETTPLPPADEGRRS